MKLSVAKLCLTLCNSRDCSLPVSSCPWDSPGKWSGLPFLFPVYLPNPGIEPWSPALQADSLPSELPGKPRIAAKIPPNPFHPSKRSHLFHMALMCLGSDPVDPLTLSATTLFQTCWTFCSPDTLCLRLFVQALPTAWKTLRILAWLVHQHTGLTSNVLFSRASQSTALSLYLINFTALFYPENLLLSPDFLFLSMYFHVYCLSQGLAKYCGSNQSCPLFINKVLLECSHTHLFTYF